MGWESADSYTQYKTPLFQFLFTILFSSRAIKGLWRWWFLYTIYSTLLIGVQNVVLYGLWSGRGGTERGDEHVDDGDEEDAHQHVVVDAVRLVQFRITAQVASPLEDQRNTDSHLKQSNTY